MVDHVFVELSSDQENPDLADAMTVAAGRRDWTRDFSHLLANHTQLDKIYVILHARNILGFEGVAAYGVTVDNTPPSEGIVEFVTRTDNSDALDVQHCQVPWMYVEIYIHGLVDVDTGIDR